MGELDALTGAIRAIFFLAQQSNYIPNSRHRRAVSTTIENGMSRNYKRRQTQFFSKTIRGRPRATITTSTSSGMSVNNSDSVRLDYGPRKESSLANSCYCELHTSGTSIAENTIPSALEAPFDSSHISLPGSR